METDNEKNEIMMEDMIGDTGNFKTGDIITGKIIHIDEEAVLIDIGYKSEGVLDLSEFANKNEIKQLKVGDNIEVMLVKKYDAEIGGPRVSYKRAVRRDDYKKIEQAYNLQSEIQVKIIRKIKGGVMVDLKGSATKESVIGFMPASHIGYPPVKDLDAVIGKVVPARIIEFKTEKDNIVVSWRLVVESEVKAKREEVMGKLNQGDVVKGKVIKITGFGAFVDLGGIDGLLHIGDISWGHVNKVEDVIKVGEELDLKVLEFDRPKEKISLGLKQLGPHPWDNVAGKYPIGSVISGRVTGLTSFGAFVEFTEGLEGMIHVSDMSWAGNVKKPSDVLKVGEIVETKVLKIDEKNRKMALGLKQVQPNPWKKVKDKYPQGSKLTGTVTHLAAFGAFVKLEEGIEGMIHISDMSWTKKVTHPKEVLHVGEHVEVVVLGVSVDEEKISLGLKQKSDNPYDKYHLKSNVQGKVAKLTDTGAYIELEDGIEGFIHISKISTRRLEKVEEELKVGDNVWATIIKVNPRNKIIELSIKEYYKSIERSEVEKYINQESSGHSIGEIIKAKQEEKKQEEEFKEYQENENKQEFRIDGEDEKKIEEKPADEKKE